MLTFSTKFVMAIDAVLSIAAFGGQRAMTSDVIYGLQGASPRSLETILQELVHAGVLEGVCGPSGGYRLACAGSLISLAHIALAVRNAGRYVAPSDIPAKTRLASEIVRPLCAELDEHWLSVLGRITIEDLRLRAVTVGLIPTETGGAT